MVPVPKLLPSEHSKEANASFYGRHVHLIGIGGSGMCNVSHVLLRQGALISGSDCQAGEATLRLQAGGAHVAIGDHDAANLPPQTELVVCSAAICAQNPELAEARRRGLEIIGYADLVGRLMGAKVGIAIAGTHGKSTTTAMTAYALRGCGKDPTFVIGAHARQLGGGSGVGRGPHFIVEACEFNRSFHRLRPRYAAMLNIEEDHLDYYRDLEEIRQAFGEFGRLVPDHGVLLVNGDDPSCLRAAPDMGNACEHFAVNAPADWRAENLQVSEGFYRFGVDHAGRSLAHVRLSVPGLHNVYNALAAFALAWHTGAKPERIARALSDFAGCERRLTQRGAGRGITLLDDFAHHPTEIRASLSAARQRYSPRNVWVVFQPHQHSRTRFLLEDFARSFALADRILVPDIFFVRDSETERSRIGADELVRRIRRHGREALHVPDFSNIVEHLANHVQSGDLVITMGAGDVWKVADELIVKLGLERM